MTFELVALMALGVALWLYTCANFLGVGRQPVRQWISLPKLRWAVIIVAVGVLGGLYLHPEQLLERVWLPLLAIPALALVNRYVVHRSERHLTLWFLLKQCYFEITTIFGVAVLVGSLA